jgi:NADH-quinone oxidoreductase subunit L
MAQMVIWIAALPALAFVILAFIGFKLKKLAALLSIGALFGSFLLSLLVAQEIFAGKIIELNYAWLGVASFSLRVDLMAAWMLLLVSGVGLLIQIYSVGYMEGDPRFHRFFAFLSLSAQPC